MRAFVCLVRAETRKVAGRKLIWGLLLLVVGFVALATVLPPVVVSVAGDRVAGDLAGLEELAAVVSAPSGYVFAAQQAVQQTVLAAVILAAVSMGNEYSWGTLTITLVLEPRRMRVLVAKLLALTGIATAGAVIGWVVGLAMSAAVQPLITEEIAASSTYDGFWIADAVGALGRGILVLAVWTSIAACIGILTRSPAAAVGVGIGATIAEGLLALAPGVAPALLTTNALALTSVADVSQVGTGLGAASTTPIPVWQAALVLVCYLAAFFALGAVFLRRRDVT